MQNKVQEDLDELVNHRVITQEVADNIAHFYLKKQEETPSKLLFIFGILGALLGGLGIILIFAHNWDDFSTSTKCLLSLAPLLIGQIFCGFTLLKKPESKVWRESSSSFLFFAVGASISLIAQTYHISGDFPQFIMTWMLLGLPLVYIMKSQVISLLYLIGITVFCMHTNYFNYSEYKNHTYWWLLLGIVPNYYHLINRKLATNFTTFHNWFIAISLTIGLGSLTTNKNDTLLVYTYTLLFSSFYFIGKLLLFHSPKKMPNSYLLIGKLGLLYVLFMLSFRWFWDEIAQNKIDFNTLLFGVTVVLFALVSFLLYQFISTKKTPLDNLIQYAFLGLLLVYFIHYLSIAFAVVLTNLFLLFLGIKEISQGNSENSIARMNFGLLIIAILVSCRFFDTHMSFIVRGILFVVVSIGFFTLNYVMLRKKRQDEK
jgi:uncharacterized membrane protein